jgi:hypothetical protein
VERFKISSLLNFDKMVTPVIVKILFIVGVVLSVIFGIIQIISGAASSFGEGIQVIMGLITIVVGPFITRVYCELLIVTFKIHESLQQINSKIQNNPTEDI